MSNVFNFNIFWEIETLTFFYISRHSSRKRINHRKLCLISIVCALQSRKFFIKSSWVDLSRSVDLFEGRGNPTKMTVEKTFLLNFQDESAVFLKVDVSADLYEQRCFCSFICHTLVLLKCSI